MCGGGAPFASAGGASWFAVLDGVERERALRVVEGVCARLGGVLGGEVGDPSLSGGLAGLAVFFAEVERACGGERARALGCLEGAVEVLAGAPLGPSLYPGFAGVGWAVEVVGRLLGLGGEDRNEAIDEALLGLLMRWGWGRAPFDLVLGLVGVGVYVLERWPRPVAVACLERVVGEFGRGARRDGDGVYWWTAPSLLLGSGRVQTPVGRVDLGVAHGVGGVIAVLARAARLLPESEAGGLLGGAVRWLLAHAVAGEGGPSIPYVVAEGVDVGVSRSAWCYGDPGVAAVLLVAAREVGERSWEEFATGLAVRAAERPVELSGVTDAGFCHGSAGLGHLFNRMFQMTGEARLGEAARFWLLRTVEWCEAALSGGVGGSEVGGGVPWSGSGIVEGAAGVGLALLAGCSAVEPAWDRMFVVSRLAPQAGGGGP